MLHSVKLPASKLTLNAPGDGPITSGGEEAGQALMRQIRPEGITDAIEAAIERGGRSRTAALVEGISGTSQRRSKEYRAVQRNIEYWRAGRKPSPKTVAKYQAAYQQHTGHASNTLTQVAKLLSGETPPDVGTLPRGDLVIRLAGLFLRYPGSRRSAVDLRPGPITFTVKPNRRAHGIADPVGEFLRIAQYEINDDFEIHNVERIEMTFDER